MCIKYQHTKSLKWGLTSIHKLENKDNLTTAGYSLWFHISSLQRVFEII